VGRPCSDVAAEAVNRNWPRKNFGRSKQTTASTPALRTETKWLTPSFPRRPRWSDKRLSRRRPTSLQQVRRLGLSGSTASGSATIAGSGHQIPNQTCRGIHGSVLSGQSHQAESDSTRYTYLLIGRESRLANGRCVLTAFAVQLERCVTHNDTLAVFSHRANTERWSQRPTDSTGCRFSSSRRSDRPIFPEDPCRARVQYGKPSRVLY